MGQTKGYNGKEIQKNAGKEPAGAVTAAAAELTLDKNGNSAPVSTFPPDTLFTHIVGILPCCEIRCLSMHLSIAASCIMGSAGKLSVPPSSSFQGSTGSQQLQQNMSLCKPVLPKH